MTNPFNVEKTIQKFQQLAKDAQSMGDPVLVENYLQHADHFTRRLSELNSKKQPSLSNGNNNQKETLNQPLQEKIKTEEIKETDNESKS